MRRLLDAGESGVVMNGLNRVMHIRCGPARLAAKELKPEFGLCDDYVIQLLQVQRLVDEIRSL